MVLIFLLVSVLRGIEVGIDVQNSAYMKMLALEWAI